MRRVIAIVVLIVVAGLVWLYASGADRVILAWAVDGQREAQNGMARALRALRAGEPAAIITLLSVCFGYGFFHAVGPGHGKLLIGGYGAAAQVGAAKLSAVALVSSLAQGASAILLVGAGLWVLGFGRDAMTGAAEELFAPLSFGAIALIGLWLVWRGMKGLRSYHAHDHHHHDHSHADDSAICGTCGHAHAPAAEDMAKAASWRELAALIAAVAIRPCTGALFVLILTAQMGIFWAGVGGVLAMSLGTASVTIAVAVSAVTLRSKALAGALGGDTMARAQPVLEIVIGAVVAIVAAQFAFAAL